MFTIFREERLQKARAARYSLLYLGFVSFFLLFSMGSGIIFILSLLLLFLLGWGDRNFLY